MKGIQLLCGGSFHNSPSKLPFSISRNPTFKGEDHRPLSTWILDFLVKVDSKFVVSKLKSVRVVGIDLRYSSHVVGLCRRHGFLEIYLFDKY